MLSERDEINGLQRQKESLQTQLAERDEEVKKQADYIASCKRDAAHWWREASGLNTKNVNLQAQLAQRDAEIERLKESNKSLIGYVDEAGNIAEVRDAKIVEQFAELQANLRCRESMQHTINRLEESEFHLKNEIEAHEKREAAYLAFVAADDALEDLNLDQQVGMTGWEWEKLQENIDKAAAVKEEARERLRKVIDGMD